MRRSLRTWVLLWAAMTGEAWARDAKTPPASVADAGAGAEQVVQLRVTEKGFQPSPVTVKAGKPVKLVVTRVSDDTCATDLVIPEENVKVALPLNTPVEVTLTPKKAGQIVYGCAMNMMESGVLLVR
jgi:plastocyanin domain-containing protein